MPWMTENLHQHAVLSIYEQKDNKKQDEQLI